MGTAVAIGLLAVHLLAMNVAAAGPLVCAWLVQLGGDGEAALARHMARRSLAALGAGILLGALMFAPPNAALRAALSRFPASTYWFAAAELAFSAVCMTALATFARRQWPRAAWATAIATASNLLYHFPPLMGIIGKLSADPRWASEKVITHSVLRRLAARPEVLALSAHFAVASIAAAAVLALWPNKLDAATPAGKFERIPLRRLAIAALVATVLQIPIGLWMLVTASPATRDELMGGGFAASACFLAGVVAAIALLQTLAAIALGEDTPRMRRRAAWLLAMVVALMSATLTLSRTASPPIAAEQRSAANARALSPVLRSPLLAFRRETCWPG
jgi:hypothetical protein